MRSKCLGKGKMPFSKSSKKVETKKGKNEK